MNVHFNEDADMLTIVISDEPVHRTIEIEHGIVDLDANGEILAVEILGATEVIQKVARLAMRPNLERALTARAAEVLHDVQQQLADAKRSSGVE